MSAAADIRQARRRLGLTQAEVAHRAGIAVRTVRDLERGRAAPRPDTIQRLDRVLSSPETDRDLPRVRVLGPMIVDAPDGVRMHLASRRRQVLLAMLAVHPNEPVRADELLELAWPEPARGTAAALHTQISRLRQTLRPLQLDHDAGYRLMATGDDLDLIRFRNLVAQARRCWTEGRLDEAVRAGRSACALVRGPVLDNLPELAGHPVVVAIRRELVSSVLDLADTALAAGSAGDAVEALTAAADREPLDESIATRLIQVLHATGKRALALDSYRALRARLAAELGVDPSPDLQRSYQDVLCGPTTSQPAAIPMPRQLPADVRGFTGRIPHLAQLDEQLDGHGSAVVITAIGGAGGVGKTALAVHWAHRVMREFPDGQLYIDLQGFSPLPALRPIDALARFLAELGVPGERIPTTVEQAAALYRSLLADKHVLVVLDNATSAEQVRPLLPASGHGFVLVTSRDRLTGLIAKDGAARLSLDTLTDDESQTLLRRLLGASRVTAEPEASVRLARLCGHLPLALRIAAANFIDDRHGTLTAYVGDLSRSDRLDALRIHGDEHLAIRSVFDASYAALPPGTQRTFRLLGLIPGVDFTRDAVAALTAVMPRAAARELDALAAGYLVDEYRPGRYRLHDLLRLYARERAGGDPDRTIAGDRLYRWFLHTAAAATSALLYPQLVRLPLPPDDISPTLHFASHEEASSWLDAERRNLVAVAFDEARLGAGQLVGTLRPYLLLRMRSLEMTDLATAALNAPRADDRSRAAAHLILADAARHAGDYPDATAHCDAAAQLAQHADWPAGQSSALCNLGNMYAETGRLQHAVGYYQDALAINRTARRRSGQATNLLNLGNLQIELGRIGAAGECYTEALELARLEGNTVREGRGLHGLAGVLHTQGHLDAARDHYARSLELFGDIGDLRGASLGEIADVECDIGDIEGARRHAEDAILLAHEFGSRYDEAHALNTLAMVEHRLGHADAAAATFRRALRLAEQSQVSTAQIVALRGIAISTARGNPTQAMEHADHALALARTNGMRLLEAVALTARSAAECWTDPTRAIETVGSALSILNGCGARLHEARARATLGAALAADGDGAAARAQWHGALAVFTECGAAPEADGVRALLN